MSNNNENLIQLEGTKVLANSQCDCVIKWGNKVKDRLAWTTNVIFVVVLHYESLQVMIFLLQGCLLEIYLFCMMWLETFYNCFQQRLIFYYFLACDHLLLKILMCGNERQQSQFVFCICLSDGCLKSKLTSDTNFSMHCLGYPWTWRCCLKFARHWCLWINPLWKPLYWYRVLNEKKKAVTFWCNDQLDQIQMAFSKYKKEY